jgi:general stress protein 26
MQEEARMFGSDKDEDEAAKAWRMMDELGFCMLATLEGEGGATAIRARPMAAYVCREEGAVYFLTDAESAKAEELEARPQVNLAFGDPRAMQFVSVSGTASVSNDREKIRELWGTPAKAWWDSPDDPSLRVLKVAPADAQYWDSPGKLRAYVRMAAAAVSDARPAMGENEKVTL